MAFAPSKGLNSLLVFELNYAFTSMGWEWVKKPNMADKTIESKYVLTAEMIATVNDFRSNKFAVMDTIEQTVLTKYPNISVNWVYRYQKNNGNWKSAKSIPVPEPKAPRYDDNGNPTFVNTDA